MTKFKLVITPAIPIEHRHAIQDLLKSKGYDVWASGQEMNDNTCDISFDSEEGSCETSETD